jgi:hypothetical protein
VHDLKENRSLKEKNMIARGWIVCGMIAGILAHLAYVLAVAPSALPPQIATLSGIALGPLLCLAFVGLYGFFAAHRKTVALQAGAIFGVIAGTIVTMMIVVQSAIRLAIPSEFRVGMGLVWDGLNMVQLGLELSWGIYFAAATILLGVAMRSHPRFGWIWGDVTLLVGAGLLTLNVLAFPFAPTPAALTDLGPIAAFWYLIVFLRALTSLKRVDQPANELPLSWVGKGQAAMAVP